MILLLYISRVKGRNESYHPHTTAVGHRLSNGHTQQLYDFAVVYFRCTFGQDLSKALSGLKVALLFFHVKVCEL